MKTLPKAWTAIIYFLISIFVILQSCKDAPISPGTNGPPSQGQDSLLFQKDSLSAYHPGNPSVTLDFINSDTCVHKIRIQFSISGSCLLSRVRYLINTPIDEFCNFSAKLDSTISNQIFSYQYDFTIYLFHYNCLVSFIISAGYYGAPPAWIKLKELRIYKSKL